MSAHESTAAPSAIPSAIAPPVALPQSAAQVAASPQSPPPPPSQQPPVHRLSTMHPGKLMEQLLPSARRITVNRDEIIREGYLWIRTPAMVWKQRYFVLDNYWLHVFPNSKSLSQPTIMSQEWIPILQAVINTFPDELYSGERDKGPAYCFGLIEPQNPSHIHVFEANSPEDRKQWIEALKGKGGAHFEGERIHDQVNPQSLREGYLSKTGGSNKRFRRRYVMLLPGELQYFKKKSDAKPAGQVKLTGHSIVQKDDDIHFSVMTERGARRFLFSAGNPDDAIEWLQALRDHVSNLSHPLSGGSSLRQSAPDVSSSHIPASTGQSEQHPSLGSSQARKLFFPARRASTSQSLSHPNSTSASSGGLGSSAHGPGVRRFNFAGRSRRSSSPGIDDGVGGGSGGSGNGIPNSSSQNLHASSHDLAAAAPSASSNSSQAPSFLTRDRSHTTGSRSEKGPLSQTTDGSESSPRYRNKSMSWSRRADHTHLLQQEDRHTREESGFSLSSLSSPAGGGSLYDDDSDSLTSDSSSDDSSTGTDVEDERRQMVAGVDVHVGRVPDASSHHTVCCAFPGCDSAAHQGHQYCATHSFLSFGGPINFPEPGAASTDDDSDSDSEGDEDNPFVFSGHRGSVPRQGFFQPSYHSRSSMVTRRNLFGGQGGSPPDNRSSDLNPSGTRTGRFSNSRSESSIAAYRSFGSSSSLARPDRSGEDSDRERHGSLSHSPSSVFPSPAPHSSSTAHHSYSAFLGSPEARPHQPELLQADDPRALENPTPVLQRLPSGHPQEPLGDNDSNPTQPSTPQQPPATNLATLVESVSLADSPMSSFSTPPKPGVHSSSPPSTSAAAADPSPAAQLPGLSSASPHSSPHTKHSRLAGGGDPDPAALSDAPRSPPQDMEDSEPQDGDGDEDEDEEDSSCASCDRFFADHDNLRPLECGSCQQTVCNECCIVPADQVSELDDGFSLTCAKCDDPVNSLLRMF